MANDPILTDRHLTEMLDRTRSQAPEDVGALPGDVTVLVGEVRRLNACIVARKPGAQKASEWHAERDKLLARIVELEDAVRLASPDHVALQPKR